MCSLDCHFLYGMGSLQEEMNLGHVLRKYRLMSELSVRSMAEVVGLNASTYSRLERGEIMDGDTLASVLRWLLERV